MRWWLRWQGSWSAFVMAWVAIATAPSARAQVGAIGGDGLGGGRHVGTARVDEPAFRGMVSVGYAHTESVLAQDDRHERAALGLAAAWIARSWMQVSLRWDQRYDVHHGALGKDTGLAGSTELTSRHAFDLAPSWSAAGQLRLRFPAASGVGRSFSATTTELAAIVTRKLFETGEVTLQAGYRFDRTDQAFPASYPLSAADALGASMSRFDAALLGALFAMPLGAFTAVGELSWEPFVGSGAPGVGESATRLRAAVQRRFGERFVPSIELGVNLAQRPTFDAFTRIEPRLWAALNLAVSLDRTKPEPPPAAEVARAEPAPSVAITLQVLGADRQPAASAKVTWVSERGTREAVTDEAGRAAFDEQVGERVHVIIQAPGAVPLEQDIVVGVDVPELTMQLQRALPDGELKGKVRSLGGAHVKARIELLPRGDILETDADGSFQVSVPPGDYRLRVTAPGYEPQERPALVERMGVTIIVVDLRKGSKR